MLQKGQGQPDYNRKAHSVYLLTYHIVFVTKYRRPVITNEIGDFMKNHAAGCHTIPFSRYIENPAVKRSQGQLPGSCEKISLR